MTDRLSSLPRSNDHTSDTDMNVIKSMFGNTTNPVPLNSSKRLLFISIIFFVINLPFIDSALKSVIPETSDIIHLFIKTIIFVVIILIGQVLQLA